MRPSTIVLRNGLIGVIAPIVLSIGAVGMSVLAGLREPAPRQVVDDVGSLVRVVSVQPSAGSQPHGASHRLRVLSFLHGGDGALSEFGARPVIQSSGIRAHGGIPYPCSCTLFGGGDNVFLLC